MRVAQRLWCASRNAVSQNSIFLATFPLPFQPQLAIDDEPRPRTISEPVSSAVIRNAAQGERDAPLRDDLCAPDVAASFQDAATDALVNVSVRAASDFDASAVYVSGGVSANGMLRQKRRDAVALPVHAPPLELCGDNASMIGAAGHFRFAAGLRSGLDIEARANWLLSENLYDGG